MVYWQQIGMLRRLTARVDILFVTATALASIFLFASSISAASSTNYSIGQESGGPIYSPMSSTNYQLQGIIGAPGVGQSTSAGYIIDHGFTWMSSASAVCGNSVVETGEDCDDGNIVSGDGCDSSCQNEGNPPPPTPVCGNGTVETGETCDDDNVVNGDGCSSSCHITTQCSDGIDNDSDQAIDYPADLGCDNSADNDETDPPACFSEDFTANPISTSKWITAGHLMDPNYTTVNGQYLYDLVGVGSYSEYLRLRDVYNQDKTNVVNRSAFETFVPRINKYLFLAPLSSGPPPTPLLRDYKYVLDDFKAELKFSGLDQTGPLRNNGIFRFILYCSDNYTTRRIELNRKSGDSGAWGGTWAQIMGFHPPEVQYTNDPLKRSSSGTFRFDRTGNSVAFFVDGQKFHQMNFDYLPRACVVELAPDVQFEGSNLKIAIDEYKIFNGCHVAACGNGVVESSNGEKCDLGVANGVCTPSAGGCSSDCKAMACPGQCNNKYDDDSDGSCDWNGCIINGKSLPPDFSCQDNINGESEFLPKAACDDGIDNDNDGYIDLDGYGEYFRDPGCSSYIDEDETDEEPSPCGNGRVDYDEECDYGILNSNTGACLASCQLASCGDGYIRTGIEDCDDSNTAIGDGCSASCKFETLATCFAEDFTANPLDSNKWTYSRKNLSTTEFARMPTTTGGKYFWNLTGIGDLNHYNDLWAIYQQTGDSKDKLVADEFASSINKWITLTPKNQYVYGDFAAEEKYFGYYSYGDFPYRTGGLALITVCKDNNTSIRADFMRYRKYIQASFNGYFPPGIPTKRSVWGEAPDSGTLRVERHDNSLMFYLSGKKFHQMDFSYLPQVCIVDTALTVTWEGTINQAFVDDFKIFNVNNSCYAETCGNGVQNLIAKEDCDLGAANGTCNASGSGCSALCKGMACPGQCTNGVDDDQDGTCDWNGCTVAGKALPPDFSCTSASDPDEYNDKPECSDKVDNDDDGYTDFDGGDDGLGVFRDSCCSSYVDNSESDCGTIDDCGDGEVNFPQEVCDDGTNNSDTKPDACRTSCMPAFCGDNIIDTGEDCDDGNTLDGDQCSETCKSEAACFAEDFNTNPLSKDKWSSSGHLVSPNYTTTSGRFWWDLIGTGDWAERIRLYDIYNKTKKVEDRVIADNYANTYNKYLTLRPKSSPATYLYLNGDFATEVKYFDYYSYGKTPYQTGGFHLSVECKDNNTQVVQAGITRYGKTVFVFAGTNLPGSCYGVAGTAPNTAVFRIERQGDSLIYYVSGEKFCQINYAHLPQVCKLNTYQNASFNTNNRVSIDDFKVQNGCYVGTCGDGIQNSYAGEECDLGTNNSPACVNGNGCSRSCKAMACPGQCSNGKDDDNDGTCDWNGCFVNGRLLPPDFSCQGNKDATSEYVPKPECSDSVDNDNDKLVDMDGGGKGSAYVDYCCSSYVDDDESDCSGPACGDGELNFPQEVCDNGSSNSNTAPDACRTSCVPAYCSDGVIDTGEECDDGNKTDGDGCSAECKKVPQCADKLDNDVDDLIDLADPDCTDSTDDSEFPEAKCGNNFVDPGETCDDGNSINGDGCSENCQTEPAICGNGRAEGKEECDDGNTVDDDSCSNSCKTKITGYCGDGIVDPGKEGCDDGNKTSLDGCSNSCQLEENPPVGCAYNNPACVEGLICVDNVCKDPRDLKGCAYNKPPCGEGFVCAENMCVPAFLEPIAKVTTLINDWVVDKLNNLLEAINAIPAVQLLNRLVLDNPQVEDITRKWVIPTLITIGIVNTITVLPALGFLSFISFIFTEPLHFWFWKRRKYGMVYNAITKQPIDLAAVRIYSAATNKLVSTQVTDAKGRYSYIGEPGEYYLKVQKQDYQFPSSSLGKNLRDGQYADLYYGAPVVLTDQENTFALNVPLDPELPVESDKQVLRLHRRRKLQHVLSFMGPILAIVVLLILPGWFQVLMVCVHTSLFVIFHRITATYKPKSYGSVFDRRTKATIKNSIVRIFDTQYNKLLATQVVTTSGRYNFLVGPNTYYLTVSQPEYQPYKSKILDYRQNKENVVDLDIGLERATGRPTIQPPAPQPPIIHPPVSPIPITPVTTSVGSIITPEQAVPSASPVVVPNTSAMSPSTQSAPTKPVEEKSSADLVTETKANYSASASASAEKVNTSSDNAAAPLPATPAGESNTQSTPPPEQKNVL